MKQSCHCFDKWILLWSTFGKCETVDLYVDQFSVVCLWITTSTETTPFHATPQRAAEKFQQKSPVRWKGRSSVSRRWQQHYTAYALHFTLPCIAFTITALRRAVDRFLNSSVVIDRVCDPWYLLSVIVFVVWLGNPPLG